MDAMAEQPSVERSRAGDLGIVLGTLSPGPLNAMTDVVGVRVGHATLVRGSGPLVRGVEPVRTGVTAVLPHEGNLFLSKVAAAATVFNSFGKTLGLMQLDELGQLETPILLTNTLNVGRVADALVSVMLEQNPAIGVSTLGIVNAVVCECNDGYLNDIQGRHVGEPEVRPARSPRATLGRNRDDRVWVCWRHRDGLAATGSGTRALHAWRPGSRELWTPRRFTHRGHSGWS
jgi:D-aminopeptidase